MDLLEEMRRVARHALTEALWEAMGMAVAAITRDDARAWFAHAGYALPTQPT
jgi:hypothetical protein